MAKLLIHGRIGGTLWDKVSSNWVIGKLDEFDGEEVHVHINSGGGDVFHGIAIYQALKDYDGDVIVHVDALAASAASVIAMAGKEIIMGDAAMMMIHNPWSITIGDAADHRKNAKTLDSIREGTLNAYIYQTDKDKEELRELLDDETWYDAHEAVEEGFATSVDGETDDEDIAALAEFDFSDFQNVPQRLRARVAAAVQSRRDAAPIMAMANDQGVTVPKANKKTGNDSTTQPGEAVDEQQVRADERQKATDDLNARMSGIREACTKVGLGEAVAFNFIEEGISVDAARERVIDMIAEDTPDPAVNANPRATSSGVGVLTMASENFVKGGTQALAARAGLEDHDPQNAYSSYTLMDFCRATAMQAGISTKGVSRMGMIGKVFAAGGHTASDFPLILENVFRKGLLVGWEENAETFEEWTKKGSLSDFKETSRLNLNLFDSLDEIPDGGTYKQGTIGEHGEKIQLATYGKMFRLTRRVIINDDLQVFNDAPLVMGRAAKRTLGTLVYGQFIENVTMGDGTVLFHANHKNTATGAGLAVDTFNARKVAMATQKDPDDKAEGGLNMRPAYLLVPFALEDRAESLMGDKFDPDNTDKKNTAKGKAKVIAESRLDYDNAGRWYLAADQNLHSTMEVAYLDGRDEPELEQQKGWTVDGMEYKVRLDAGVRPLDFRAFQRATA